MTGPVDPTAGLRPLEHAPRLGRLRERMADAGVDGLVVTSLPNIRYLTGFTGSAARLWVGPNGATLVTDGRYQDQADAELAAAGVDCGLSIGRTQAAQRELLVGLAAGVARLGLEAASVSWAEQRAYASAFGVDLVPTSDLVERLRAVKDAGEVARIEAACDIASAALAEVLPLAATGVSERTFAHALEDAMRARGASGPSFDTIVSAGANAALPHHRADHTPIALGDLLVIDFGCVVDGYCSDMTRTVVVGDAPAGWQAELVEVATAAQAAGVAAVRPGLGGRELHETCAGVIDARGMGELFTHGTGHGVGLQIHESPWAGPAATDTLVVGNVVTVEPGVYRVGLGGVRVEDTVLVTPHGCRPLTKTPKDLSCLPSPRTT